MKHLLPRSPGMIDAIFHITLIPCRALNTYLYRLSDLMTRLLHAKYSLSALTFFFFFFGLVTSSSCKTAKPAVTPGDPLPQALLWKIEGKNIKEPSYLFGTIHLIPQEDFFLPVGFDDALNNAKQVVFEIDMDEMSDMSSMMGLLGQIMMKDGVTLRKLLSADEYKEVENYFDAMGIPMFLLNKVKPMFLTMLAEVNMDPESMGSDDIISYEMDIYNKANTAEKEVGGLETMEYQMSLFDSIPYKDQASMLVETIRNTNAGSDSFDETVELYKLQNIEAMVALSTEDETVGGYEDILLNNRNQNWIPKMATMMAAQSTFFAVGAGHLGGKTGVIRLLQKEGYKVTPVSVYRPVASKRI